MRRGSAPPTTPVRARDWNKGHSQLNTAGALSAKEPIRLATSNPSSRFFGKGTAEGDFFKSSTGNGRHTAPFRQYRAPYHPVSETKNAFALKSKSYPKISSRVYSAIPNGAANRFPSDPRYELTLGGGVPLKAKHEVSFNLPSKSLSSLPILKKQTEQLQKTRFSTKCLDSDNSSFYQNRQDFYNNSRRSKSMMSLSSQKSQQHQQLSLMEQKKLQWAKEREEQSSLWTPWGRDPNKLNVSQNHNEFNPSSEGIQQDCYLPPINDSNHQHHRYQRSNSLVQGSGFGGNNVNQGTHAVGGGGDFSNTNGDRKASLPAEFSGRSTSIQLVPHEKRSTYHKEGNAEWMIIDNGNTGDETNSPVMLNGEDRHDRTGGISPRVIVHKIYMDSTKEERTTISSRADAYESNSKMNNIGNSPNGNYDHYGKYVMPRSGGDAYLEEKGNLSSNIFGGSTGYLGNKPPPVAMRSSLTIGLPSPSARFGGSFEDIEKKEKEQWLSELNKQREENRIRKLMEKDDKRARWGDRGVGVGHFWEASDSSMARLPSREREDLSSRGSDTPPAWLQRSLQMQSSRSHPNLYDGPLPTQFVSELSSSNNNLNIINQNPNYNRSSIDIRTPDVGDKNFGSDQHQSSRTFLRGQNVPTDPNDMVEKERKFKANQEYLEEVKKQIEDNKRRQRMEKENQEKEEREHERRMEKQRQLELERLEMERRKRNPETKSQSSSKSETDRSKHESSENSTGIQIFESRRPQQQNPNHQRDVSQLPKYESPLIPHQTVTEPDAYEVALARRQSKMLSDLQSQSTSKSESMSFSDPDLNLRSYTPTPPAESSENQDQGYQNRDVNEQHTIDQCLMTDSDHLYERTLTPSRDRRSHSMETSRSREFGTQTEHSNTDLTTDLDTDRDSSIKHNSRSKSISNFSEKKAEEKPRWGANPVKKVYLKQSEKDPNYQQKIRRKSDRLQLSTAETDNDNEINDIPFHRIQNRSRNRTKKSPLKANSYNSHQSQSCSHSQSHVSAHFRSDEESTTTTDFVGQKNNVSKTKSKSPPKLPKKNEKQLMRKVVKASGSESNRNAAERHLGHIGVGGLNSVGASEESSGFTSPSLTTEEIARRQQCSTGDSLPSSASNSNSEYVPMYSREFVSQVQFDEQPINAGKPAPAYALGNAFIGNRLNLGKSTEKIDILPKQKIVNRNPVTAASRNKAKSKENGKLDNKIKRKQDDLESCQPSHPRDQSPPVPALAKKLEMGLYPDESGRLSSLPPELLSPVPSISLGAIIPHTSLLDLNSISGESRLSSAEPKVDIDIAITSASNPDLQELLNNFELSARSARSYQSLQSCREEELLKFPDILSGRSGISQISNGNYSRPVTNATDLSLQAQEEFIRELMSQTEVQEQLSARENELSEKGIIEFNIRLPSSWAPPALTSGKSRKTSSRSVENRKLIESGYKDPLERRKAAATAQWLLHSLDDSSPREALLTNLSSLKQGIKLQHELVHTTASDYYE